MLGKGLGYFRDPHRGAVVAFATSAAYPLPASSLSGHTTTSRPSERGQVRRLRRAGAARRGDDVPRDPAPAVALADVVCSSFDHEHLMSKPAFQEFTDAVERLRVVGLVAKPPRAADRLGALLPRDRFMALVRHCDPSAR